MSQLILVISDTAVGRDFREALRPVIEGDVVLVSSRRELPPRRRPSLAVLDLALASEPPCDFLAWMRSKALYQDVPVFVLGSNAAKSMASKTWLLGVGSCFLIDPGPEKILPIAEGVACYASLLTARAPRRMASGAGASR